MLEPLNLSRIRGRHDVGGLVQRRLGLVTLPHRIAHVLREPDGIAVAAPLGDLSFVAANIQTGRNRSGIGTGADADSAWIRAVVEAAERYACLVYNERDFIVETADALGDEALDLDSIPVCSASELRDPKCPVRPASTSHPIRWVEGTSLISGRKILVPAIMTHLSMVPWESELFWLQISTGAAGHTDPEAALVSAICECVERDAISVTWLGQLRVPLVEAGMMSGALKGADMGEVNFRFFDATSDLGIPTILSVQGPGPDVPVSMTCATAPTLEEALRKAYREAMPMRTVLYQSRDYPADAADFTEVIHGAAFFADGNQPEAFDFLATDARARLAPAEVAPSLTASDGTPRALLRALIDLFRKREMEVIVVDLTTDELREAGVWIVRAIIPALMPLSFVYRARYLGTPRLHGCIAKATGRPFDPAAVNPHPMPFA